MAYRRKDDELQELNTAVQRLRSASPNTQKEDDSPTEGSRRARLHMVRVRLARTAADDDR